MNTLPHKPKLSFVVVVYNMPRQAMNTLFSLSAKYQRNITEEDYEILVVENQSDNNLTSEKISELGNNFRYFLRQETSQSPVGAINFGLAQAKADHICLMVDGARMLTPRVVEYALMAIRANTNALIAVPGYSLGWQDQHHHIDAQYGEAQEIALLNACQWQQNGYRLFDIATISGANAKGPLQLFLECNCLFTSRIVLEDIGGADERFDLLGGGSINLHLYRKIGVHSNNLHYFVIAGEGSFHQYHGGVTTSQQVNRDQLLEQFREQLEDIWGGKFGGAVKREPILLWALSSQALPFIKESSRHCRHRFQKLSAKGTPFWIDDAPYTRYTCGED